MAWGSRKLRELLPGTPRDRVHKRRHLCAASALFAAAVSPRGFTQSIPGTSGKPPAGGLYCSLKPVLPYQAMSSVSSGSV